MPTLMELQNRFAVEPDFNAIDSSDEALVTDSRGSLTPSQIVESKLRSLLSKDAPTASASKLVRSKAK